MFNNQRGVLCDFEGLILFSGFDLFKNMIMSKLHAFKDVRFAETSSHAFENTLSIGT